MTTVAAPIANSSLLTSFAQQTQDATAAAKAQMSANVNNGSNAATAGVTGNFSTFLKILTTQLSNQDPTSPMDTNQFTQELVEFSGVEQQINTNSLLQKLLTGQSSSSLAANLNYIGDYVQAPSPTNDIILQGGTSEFGYTLASAANTVGIQVLDSTGKTVATLAGPSASGPNYASWDGKDQSGTQLPDGIYTFKISALDNGGNAITVSNPLSIAKVTALQTAADGSMQLICDGLAVSSSDINAVYQQNSLPNSTALTAPPSS